MPDNHSYSAVTSSCGISACQLAQMHFNAVQYIVQPHTTLHTDCILYLTQLLGNSGIALGYAKQGAPPRWSSKFPLRKRMTCRNAVRLCVPFRTPSTAQNQKSAEQYCEQDPLPALQRDPRMRGR